MPLGKRAELLDKWNHSKEDSKMIVNLWNFPVDVYVEDLNDTMPIHPFGFLHEEKGLSKELKNAITTHAAKGLNLDFENEFHLIDAQHYYALASAEFTAEKLAGFFRGKGVKNVRVEGVVLPATAKSPKSITDFDNDSCVKKVAEILASKKFNVYIDPSRTYDNLNNSYGQNKTIKVAR